MHSLAAICTEINWLKQGNVVAYSLATEEKSFREESGTEASRGGSATKLQSGNRRRRADGKRPRHEIPEGEGKCGFRLPTLSKMG